MTYDELEALILAGGDGWALQKALAPLDEKARSKLSASVQKLSRQLHSGKAAADASDRLKAVLARPFKARYPGMHFMHSEDAAGIRTTLPVAMYGVGPLSALRKSEIRFGWYGQVDIVEQIIRDRRPDWLDAWVHQELESEFTNLKFPTLRGWIRDGVCAKPDSDGYYRMFAGHLSRRSWRPEQEAVPPISVQLLADPDLLADVEGLFRVESNAFANNSWLVNKAPPGYETWTDALIKLSAAGRLDRAALLQSALDGLNRDFKSNQLSGFHAFYKQMKPEPAEKLAHQARYIDLLCHPVGHVTKFALEMLSDIERKGSLDVGPVLRELPSVFTGDGKGNAATALKLLKRIAAGKSSHAREALSVVGEALRHAHPDIQAEAMEILAAHAGKLDAPALDALRDAEPFIAASNRPAFARLVGGADASAPSPAAGTSHASAEPVAEYRPLPLDQDHPILEAHDAIQPIATVDALIDAVFHAVETVESADEVERIVDGISRLAGDRPADFDARVAPLLHRIGKARTAHGLAIGTPGLGGAVRNLLFTWLTGKLHRKPEAEHAYFRVEDAFVPLRIHLGEIAERISRGGARPLLSAPTHRGGWIDPLVWVERLQAPADPAVADSMDLRLSLLRLAPDNRAEALERAALPEPLRAIADFALGGDARPTRSDRDRYAAWICAARARDPHRDWTAELAPLALADDLPDALQPARYDWRSGLTEPRHKHDPRQFPGVTLTVTRQASGATAPVSLLARLGLSLGQGPRTDWEALPASALSRGLVGGSRYYMGEFGTPWVAQWLGLIWPQNPAAACLRAVKRLTPRSDSDSSGWEPSQGFFQVLFRPALPWREPEHLLACIGLIGKDADARGLSVDAVIEAIDARLFDPALFADVLARVAEPGWIKLNRLADALMQIAQASPLHAAVVDETLQHALPRLDLGQTNAHRLLETLAETRALTGRPITAPVREALSKVAGSGKAARLARQLAA